MTPSLQVELMVCGRRGGHLYGKFLKRLVAKPYNSLHTRPSRYVPYLAVGNVWYKDNFSRKLAISRCILPDKQPPMRRGGICCTVWCGWSARREVRKTNAHQKHPSSRIQYTTQARFICVQKSSNFITSAYPFKFRFVSMERQYILRCTCKSAQ